MMQSSDDSAAKDSLVEPKAWAAESLRQGDDATQKGFSYGSCVGPDSGVGRGDFGRHSRAVMVAVGALVMACLLLRSIRVFSHAPPPPEVSRPGLKEVYTAESDDPYDEGGDIMRSHAMLHGSAAAHEGASSLTARAVTDSLKEAHLLHKEAKIEKRLKKEIMDETSLQAKEATLLRKEKAALEHGEMEKVRQMEHVFKGMVDTEKQEIRRAHQKEEKLEKLESKERLLEGELREMPGLERQRSKMESRHKRTKETLEHLEHEQAGAERRQTALFVKQAAFELQASGAARHLEEPTHEGASDASRPSAKRTTAAFKVQASGATSSLSDV
eukprot:TRINITY_DN122400_c0_g1_i1.p1 TRINITY_DN122400_c0_g1~~TRINITY_DN122400_c0_g1_i1.p1  ORF type:complete len:329 (-),score=90.15 TRINITY_DN122400_c0_g1_i1:364-1350(-)